MTLHAVWLMPDVRRDHLDSPHRLTFDGTIVERLLDQLDAHHLVGFDDLPDGDGAVVCIPGGYYVDAVADINDRLARLPWCVVVVYADEGAQFPDQDLKHENMRVWRQAPVPGVHHGGRYLPMGPPPNTSELLAEVGPRERRLDWFFAGQVNHRHREKAVAVLSGMDRGNAALAPTRRFASGSPRPEYLATMAESKVVPCPSGPVSADSFRVWEALEAGCIPVVDAACPVYGAGFWRLLFPDGHPFPTVQSWSEFPDLLPGLLAGWPANSTRVWAWWLAEKRRLRKRLERDVRDLGGTLPAASTTVLIPTSPIPSHPSTGIIEQTVATVRHHLPDADIIVMADGVRPGQEHYRPAYEEYLHNMLWLCAHRWGAVPLIFDEHRHQVGMLRAALPMVDTPLLLFVEHDTPLVTDEPIDWAACEHVLLAGTFRTIRFHYEGVIPKDHDHLMLDKAPVDIDGLGVIRTVQWSSRPHLSRTDYYQRMLGHFTDGAVSFTEDLWHGVLQDDAWENHRLAIYAPGDGSNLKRSDNLDGRKNDPKADCVF